METLLPISKELPKGSLTNKNVDHLGDKPNTNLEQLRTEIDCQPCYLVRNKLQLHSRFCK